MKYMTSGPKALLGFLLAVNLGLGALVVFLMNHVQNLLDLDVRINLTEVVNQNKDAITSRLQLNIKSLDVLANQITETMKSANIASEAEAAHFLNQYALDNNTNILFVADRTGKVVWKNGNTLDISGRTYFYIALSGTGNISDKSISRIDGSDIFIISVPLLYQNKIIGTLQRLYSSQKFYEICSPSLFSAQGFIHIINSEGHIVLHSVHPNCWQVSDNYYQDLIINGNESTAIRLKDDILHKRTGFQESRLHGEKIFSAYSPIGMVHDWYLITSVPTTIVSPNATTVIKIFYGILLALALAFASSATYFLWYKGKQRENLERIAFVDNITGGNTYTKFLLDSAKAVQALPATMDTPLHIVKFDIDNFKYINKFYGFEFGDTILKRIVESITPALHSGETLARMSSDHFVMLLHDASEARLTYLLSSTECGGGGKNDETALYFSAGVYTVSDKEESINLMVDKAATAAHEVKRDLGKRIAYYTEEFDRTNIHNEQLKRAVVQGIEHNQFIPFFQPKVDINTRQLVGCEALARWRTSDGIVVSPAQFIPMSEQTGLIVDIDMMIYEKVLKFLSEHLEAGHVCVPISVNFSRLHLLDEVFFDKVVEKLKEYNVPPHLIEIELTESAIFDNLDSIYAFTERMHAHGLLIAMDDFGSGYSSLNMLKDVPIDVLKIDKGFLDAARDNDRRDIIFSSIVVMAHKLNIRIVVEGVEYIENVDLMRECGCSIAQGYYFARPMPEEEFSEVMLKGHV